MMHVECDNCLGMIDRGDLEEMIHRNLDDPDFVRFAVTCDRCGATTVIGQIHADDYEFGDIDREYPYLSMRLHQGRPGINSQGFFNPLSL